MNVSLTKTFGFSALLVADGLDHPVINDYRVMIDMLTVTDSAREQNIAYSRMRYWVHEVMQDSILINRENSNLGIWQATNMRCLALPSEPIDQILGMMMYTKFVAMMSDRIMIQRVSISSDFDDNIVYHHSDGEDLGSLAINGWWNDPAPIWQLRSKPKDAKHKVINLVRCNEWEDLKLSWSDVEEGNVIVLADFNKDADK